MEEFTDDSLCKFHPVIREMITELIKTDQCFGIGINGRNIRINKIYSSKCNESDEIEYANQILMSIPFAGHYVQWKVNFYNDDLAFAPDFDFGDDDFLDDYDVDNIAKSVPSLAKWNPNCSYSLLKVLKEFLNVYKNHQIKLLDNEQYSRLHFEYSSLVTETDIKSEDVEVLIEAPNVIHFLISLSVDFGGLPPYLYAKDKPLNPGNDYSFLTITFRRLNGSVIHPQLFLSPHIEQALGGTKTNHIPPFPADGCLMDYVPQVQSLLANKVKAIVDNHQLRSKYICELVARFITNIIEYDNYTYSQASLLVFCNNSSWILTVTLGSSFPKDKPTWTIRSTCLTTLGKPNIETLDDYPYSPRWCVEEMINRAYAYTLNNEVFQTNLVDEKELI